MKSKIAMLKISILAIYFLLSFVLGNSIGQEQNKLKDDGEASGVAFEQALKNYDTQKQKEQEVLTAKLSAQLTWAIENWLETTKNITSAKLNTRLEQKWEKLALIYPISPSHYEYNLRAFKYSLIKNEVVKTDSLSSPYKALVIIKEELYVEKYHSPDISDANSYFYTVSTNYNLNFEYKNGNFTLINSDNKIVAIENDCPAEVKRYRL